MQIRKTINKAVVIEIKSVRDKNGETLDSQCNEALKQIKSINSGRQFSLSFYPLQAIPIILLAILYNKLGGDNNAQTNSKKDNTNAQR